MKLKKYYTINLQVGYVLSLLLLIGIFKIPMTQTEVQEYIVDIQEEVVMEEVIQTKQIKTPPPPPRPPVPIEVPNDEIIEDEIINIDAELDLDGPIDLPPPPPPSNDEDGEEEIFVVVETMPNLNGGIGELQSKIVYPEIALKANIQGRVIVQFIIDEQGMVQNPRIIRGIGGGCDEEAIRVIQEATFSPGLQRGRPVKVQYSLPITFKIKD